MKKWMTVVLSATMAVTAMAGNVVSVEASEKTELELFNNKQENIGTLQTLIDKFNAQSETVTIKLNSPADPDTVLKTRMAKDDMPDIIFNAGSRIFTELSESGFLEEMSGAEIYDSINPAYIDMMLTMTGGDGTGYYAVPYAANASGVIYNKDLFEQAGVDIPKTWDEFMDVCRKLKDAGIQPFELTLKTSWTVYSAWNALAAGNQPENFVEDRKNGATSFSGTHEVVLERLSEIADNAQEDYMGTSYEDGNAAFANGAAAMLLNGNWALPEVLKTNPDLNVDMFAFPSTNDESKTKVVSGLDVVMMMSAECADKEGAMAFFRFLVEKENAQQYIDEQAAFSCVDGVEQNAENVSGLKEDIANGMVVETVDYRYPDGLDLGAILSQFFLNKTNGMDLEENIAQTLQKCDEQFDILNVF